MKPIVIVVITCLATIVLVRLCDLMMEKYNSPRSTIRKASTPPPKTQPKTAEEELEEAVLAGKLSCKPSDYNPGASYDNRVTNKNSYYGELEKIGVFHEYLYANNNRPPPCPTPKPTKAAAPTPKTWVTKLIQYGRK